MQKAAPGHRFPRKAVRNMVRPGFGVMKNGWNRTQEAFLSIANFIGTHLLPFTNPRVVCPPGRVVCAGRPNIVVTTPMRSGTHILIDLILNNMPAYRRSPLYIDLDQCAKQEGPGNDLVGRITPEAGYVIKTHMPINTPEGMADDPRILRILETAGAILTVRRSRDSVCRSLARWHGLQPDEALAIYGPSYDRFWEFWADRGTIGIDFDDLFRPDRMAAVLDDLCARVGVRRAQTLVPPPSGSNRAALHARKAITRLAGRHAPRIDTTIHTLKG